MHIFIFLRLPFGIGALEYEHIQKDDEDTHDDGEKDRDIRSSGKLHREKLGIDYIANELHRSYDFRMEFFPYMCDMDIDRLENLLTGFIVTPDLFIEKFPIEDFSLITDEDVEEIVLLRGEVNSLFSMEYLV